VRAVTETGTLTRGPDAAGHGHYSGTFKVTGPFGGTWANGTLSLVVDANMATETATVVGPFGRKFTETAYAVYFGGKVGEHAVLTPFGTSATEVGTFTLMAGSHVASGQVTITGPNGVLFTFNGSIIV
jgi:hypothetical protein